MILRRIGQQVGGCGAYNPEAVGSNTSAAFLFAPSLKPTISPHFSLLRLEFINSYTRILVKLDRGLRKWQPFYPGTTSTGYYSNSHL